MRVRVVDRAFKIEIDVAQSVGVGGTANHDERVVVFAQQVDPPVVESDLHQHQAVRLRSATQLQQSGVSQLAGHEAEEVVLFGGTKGNAGDEVQFDFIRDQPRIREREVQRDGASPA